VTRAECRLRKTRWPTAAWPLPHGIKKAAGESLPRRPNRHTHSHTRRIRQTTMLLHRYMKERLIAAFIGIGPSSFTNAQRILKTFSSFPPAALGTWKTRAVSRRSRPCRTATSTFATSPISPASNSPPKRWPRSSPARSHPEPRRGAFETRCFWHRADRARRCGFRQNARRHAARKPFPSRGAPKRARPSPRPNRRPQGRHRRLIFLMLLGICFLREAPERANGPDRRAGKWGLPLDLWVAEMPLK
jgi:hypothetical protein